MDWLGLSEAIVLIVFLGLAIPLLALYLRRRWLARQGGMFECSLRLHASTGGWALGMARYSGEYLEWFRIFSLSMRPFGRFQRRLVSVAGQRTPELAELGSLYPNQLVLSLVDREGETRELAMSQASLTGLLSWLESAPPGAGGYGSRAG